MKPQNNNPAPKDILVTKKKAAKILSISTRTLDRLIALGSLDRVYVGSSPRIRLSDLHQIIENGTTK